MINVGNLREDIELLRDQPIDKFDMSWWLQNYNRNGNEFTGRTIANNVAAAQLKWGANRCNTVCCFAGLIQLVRANTVADKSMGALQFARKRLGLTSKQAFALFMTDPYYYDRRRTGHVGGITKEEVIAYAEQMIRRSEAAHRKREPKP